jgi:hypothetical protein
MAALDAFLIASAERRDGSVCGIVGMYPGRQRPRFLRGESGLPATLAVCANVLSMSKEGHLL